MNKAILSIFSILLSLFLVSCAEQDGPAERAGENIDQSIQNSEDTINDAVEGAAEEIEEAGDTIEDAAEDAGDSY